MVIQPSSTNVTLELTYVPSPIETCLQPQLACTGVSTVQPGPISANSCGSMAARRSGSMGEIRLYCANFS